jgi:hypothetical protein
MRLLRTWGIGVGAAAALCVSATIAVGQGPTPPPTYPECTKKPTPADIEGAKGAHNAATQFYERAEYDKAIRYWNDALAFDCTANGLLKNIANAYEKLGDRAATVATLETYLKRTGPDPVLEQKVKNLKALMAPPPPTTSATAPPPPPPTATASAGPTVAPTAPPPPEGPRPYGIKPWILVGGGGALAIVGAVLLPIGAGNISDAVSKCPTRNNCKQSVTDEGNAGRAEVGAGWGLLATGVAAAGGGLVWQMLFNKPAAAAEPAAPGQPPAKQGVWFTPAGGPRQAGVVLGGSF